MDTITDHRGTKRTKKEHNSDDPILDVQTFHKALQDIVKDMSTPPLESDLSFPTSASGDEDFQQFRDKFYVVASAKN